MTSPALMVRAPGQIQLAHAIAVDEGAVGRAEIAQEEAERRRLDLEVVARHGLVLQAQRVAVLAADAQDRARTFDRSAPAPVRRKRSAWRTSGRSSSDIARVCFGSSCVFRAHLSSIRISLSSPGLSVDGTIARDQAQPGRGRLEVDRVAAGGSS